VVLPFPLKDLVPAELKPYILDYWWDMDRLHGLRLPVEELPVSELSWHLELPWWQYEGSVFTLRPRQVEQDPDTYAQEYLRTVNADLGQPIIAYRQGGRVVIMDGVHRLLKAAMEGRSTMGVKIFTEALISEIARE
jgi:hypothetical protein